MSIFTLGLDVSITGTGAVVLCDGEVVYRALFGSEASEGYEWGHRLELVRVGVLRALAVCPKIERVGIEDYARGKLNGREEMGEVTGQVKHLLWRYELPWVTVAPQQLKSWALGAFVHGKKAKEMMLRAAREEGLRTFDHNVADAFWVAKWTDEAWPDLVE